MSTDESINTPTYSHERVRMETYGKLCTDFRALSNDTIDQCACAVPCSEKWLPFVSAIEHAPFGQRNRVAGIMSKLAYFYVFIT